MSRRESGQMGGVRSISETAPGGLWRAGEVTDSGELAVHCANSGELAVHFVLSLTAVDFHCIRPRRLQRLEESWPAKL